VAFVLTDQEELAHEPYRIFDFFSFNSDLVDSARTSSGTLQPRVVKRRFPVRLGASIGGDARFGPVELPVDVSFSDILDNLQMVFMGDYRD